MGLIPEYPGSISKTVMIGVPRVPIGDFENTLSFPSEETSLDFRLPSHLPREMHHARPVLHTVFSTTQLELPLCNMIRAIMVLKMLATFVKL
jgi:hypothetical protein